MKFLLYIAKTYSITIFDPIVKELQKRDHDFAFYVSEKVQKQIPPDWQNVITKLNQAKEFDPDFVLCPGNFVDFRIPGAKVQIFHGLGVEKASHYKIRHFFDIYLTSGPYVTNRFLALKDQFKYFDILETGWPKVDYILNYNTEGLRKKYSIDDDKKVILYAPTFSSKMESASELLDVIPQIIREDEFWIFKFHELMDKEMVEKFRERLSENSIIDQTNDITPYLHLADVMISDTSSVLYEFMILNKPVITYKTIDRPDKGINILVPDKLRASIDRSFKNQNEFEENRKKHVAEINPNVDGNISKRIIDELEKVDVKSFPRKEKPLNLFRKCQIIYHSIFRKGYLR